MTLNRHKWRQQAFGSWELATAGQQSWGRKSEKEGKEKEIDWSILRNFHGFPKGANAMSSTCLTIL